MNQQKQATQRLPVGDFSRALRGDIKLAVGASLQRSWDITVRALPLMLTALAVVIAINLLLQGLFNQWIPVDPEQPNLRNQVLQGLIGMLVMSPFVAYLSYAGLLNARDEKPLWSHWQWVLGAAQRVIAVTAIQAVLMVIIVSVIIVLQLALGLPLGLVMALLFVALAYLQLSLILAVPLVLDQQLTAVRACIGSWLVVSKVSFPLMTLFGLMLTILFISALPLMLGLLFTVPMLFNLTGVVYDQLIGPKTGPALAVVEDDHVA
ncbi:hypothetical protein [Pseudidiomarina mangrovi]|uniref:hypothetical protein n=1 Tax=Pseudidiomarina mangrovi TaxID=2487133 RepID=UPI000FCB75F0|nr:hypothetical protein [Pseudidiomarina mangrovi]